MLRQITRWVIDTFKLEVFLGTRDRTVLEGQILPWLSTQPAIERVLFVGCEWYTYGYRKWFPTQSYWTLDYAPEKKVFGSRHLHLVDSMSNLAAHFAPASLDLVICNGVFGWGLNAPTDIEVAFASVHRALRPGGLFLLGWNDTPKYRPVPIKSIAALREFSPAVLAPLGTSQFLTKGPNRHTYSLFRKP
ncbi:MAG: class I SAM-dependent methyltransferase [Lacunisphaera sp.]